MADVRVLVASTRSARLLESYSASWIATLSVVGAATGFTVRVAVRDTLPSVAEIVTDETDDTEVVATEKAALVEPAGIITLAGTDATALELERFTTVGNVWPAVIVTVP